MKYITTLAIFFSIILFLFSCGTDAIDEKVIVLETNQDSLSYIIGTDIAKSLVDFKDEINLDMLVDGMNDKLDEKVLKVPEENAKKIMREFTMKMRKNQEEKRMASSQDNLDEGKKFLEENKKKEGVVTTESGLQYIVLKQGQGPKPTETDKVKVHYRGTTIDNTLFDSSYSRGEPTTFPISNVIKGWTEALLLMNVGSKYKLFIPSELAYGQKGAGQKIGPNEVLIFEVEMLDIEK